MEQISIRAEPHPPLPDLLATLFGHACAEVRIFDHSLEGSVFGRQDVLESALGFASRANASLRILLGRRRDAAWVESHPLLAGLRQAAQAGQVKCGVEVRAASGNYAESSARAFAIMDDKGFRCLPAVSGPAIASFHQKKTARIFANAFDKAFDRAGKKRCLLAL